MGLLKTPEDEELPSSLNDGDLKDTSPFKDLMATLEKPADLTAHPGTPIGEKKPLNFENSNFLNCEIPVQSEVIKVML